MTAGHDWEVDTRPLGECLLSWQESHQWSGAEAARRLRVPYPTYRDWLPGGRRACRLEGTVRLTMKLIDRLALE